MDPARSMLPDPLVVADGAASALERTQGHVLDVVREFGPLVVALAGGALLGALATGTASVGEARADLVRVVLVGSLAAAAILPRADSRWDRGVAAGLPHLRRTVRRSAAFACVFAILGSASAVRSGFRAELVLVPVVASLQFALAIGLAFFSAAVAELPIGRVLPARVLVPAWVLATPAVWLVNVPNADAAPAWNPLHHLVIAWRAILLPDPSAAGLVAESLFALAPAALLCPVLGFTVWSALDGEARTH